MSIFEAFEAIQCGPTRPYRRKSGIAQWQNTAHEKYAFLLCGRHANDECLAVLCILNDFQEIRFVQFGWQ